MRNILIEQAQFLVETDKMEPLEYLKVLNEINSLSEDELFISAVEDLETALNEGEITDEEFDLMLDEYVQDIGDEAGMQECKGCKEDVDLDEEFEVDEQGSMAKTMFNAAAKHSSTPHLDLLRKAQTLNATRAGFGPKAVNWGLKKVTR